MQESLSQPTVNSRPARPLSEIYRELVAAGATPEIIVLAIEAFESGGQIRMSGGQSGGSEAMSGGQARPDADAHERRKAWDRAYRAKRRAEMSGGQSGQSGGHTPSPASPLVPPLEVSPAPLPKTPPIIPPPAPSPEPRGVGALRLVAVQNKVKAGRWLEFRAAYPKREGGQSWPGAEKKYTALVASGILEEDLIAGANRYAQHLRDTNRFGTRYVKQALTWLNSQGWNDEYLTGPQPRHQSELMDTFDRHRREAEARLGHRPPHPGDGDTWELDPTPAAL